jgi:3D (Asp-Asp-Asp) domain-containing protein
MVSAPRIFWKKRYRMIVKLVLLGILQVTSYRPIPAQTKPECTNRNHCRTATDENVSELGIAVSQDLLDSGEVHYGDAVFVEGYGYRLVNDTMARRLTRSCDLFVYTKAEEKKVGVRHLKVWLVGRPQEEIGGYK